jgi:hypothetical protein
MTDGPQYFAELVDDIDQKAQEAMGEIVDKANWVADKLEGAAGGVLETLGHLIPGESDVEKAIDKWNNEIAPAIQEQINKLATEVADAVGKLAGEPLTLIDYSEKMIAAKATLYRQTTLKQDITNLGNTWEGAAYNSYSTVASEQSDALLALANSLQTGGELTRAGADRILQLWLDLYQHFYTFQADALSVIGSLADVGKLLGAEIAPIMDAIALVWTKVNDVALTLGEFFKNQITEASLGWEKLDSGSDGLPQNHWPRIAETSSDTMDDPANWPRSA